jgi:hypothetical protein
MGDRRIRHRFRMLAPAGNFELDPTTSLRGFSLHPDGRRFLATLVKDNSDIVLLEGFREAPIKTQRRHS